MNEANGAQRGRQNLILRAADVVFLRHMEQNAP